MSRRGKPTPQAPVVVEPTTSGAVDPPPDYLAESSGSPDAAAEDSSTPSEDELRAKVIYPFLLEKGFSPTDISIEFAFPIRRGRQLQNRPRTDALIRRNGRAIFIIECKREDYELTENDQAQAISYARLVQPEMPPYTVLTNGRRTILLDTFLGRPVEGEITIYDGMPISPAAIEQAVNLRYLANKHLLCLSSDSLQSFIMKDLEEQIQIHSKGSLRPPYSPAAHIPRAEIWDKIETFCNEDGRRLLPLIGPATIGKTSEIFSCIQQKMLSRQSNTLPLYIPLNLSGPDFLPFLGENFGWVFHQSMNIVNLIHDIDDVAIAQGKNCVVFILDGADLDIDGLEELRKQIMNLLRRTSGLRGRYKVIVAAQEATWLRLVSGQSVDLSSYCEEPAHVAALTPGQSGQHVRALESLYGIRMARNNLPSLPAITHMLAQQVQTAGGGSINATDVLGKYFRWQLSKAKKISALLTTLTTLSTRLLEDDSDRISPEYAPAGMDDAIAAGFVSRSEDMHGRESYRFTDDWIHYYVVGFHIWKVDSATPEAIWNLIERAFERVEYTRCLDWLSFVMSDHEVWRLVAQRRPSYYRHCYRLATTFLKALSVGDDASLWLAPYKGYVGSPWCSIVDRDSNDVHWGTDPEIDEESAPQIHEMRPQFGIFSRSPLVRIVSDDVMKTLKEIERWLPDRREGYRFSERLWPVQHHVFERLERRLNLRLYNLADVARTMESPAYAGGKELLRDILDKALHVAHDIAESEFHGILDLMPTKIRLEIGVAPGAREYVYEYHFGADELGVEIILDQYENVQRLSKEERELAGHRQDMGEMPLYRMLAAPYMFFPFSDPRLTWRQFKGTNRLRRINAVGNVAARWLAHGISSALSTRRFKSEIIKERVVRWLENAGVADPPEDGPLPVVEKVLNSFKEKGRIQFWQRTDSGFIVDSFYAKRHRFPGEVGFRIDALIHRAGSVRLKIRNVFMRTTAEPTPSADEVDEASLVVGRHELPDAVERLLDRVVGFPPQD